MMDCANGMMSGMMGWGMGLFGLLVALLLILAIVALVKYLSSGSGRDRQND